MPHNDLDPLLLGGLQGHDDAFYADHEGCKPMTHIFCQIIIQAVATWYCCNLSKSCAALKASS